MGKIILDLFDKNEFDKCILFFNNFKNVEHIHFYAFYIGNYPELAKKDILFIARSSKIAKISYL